MNTHSSRFGTLISAAAVLLAVLSVMTVSSCRKLAQPTAPHDTTIRRTDTNIVVHHPDTTIPRHDSTVLGPDSSFHLTGILPPSPSGAPASAAIISIMAIASLGNAGDFEVDLVVGDNDGNPIVNLSPSMFSIPGNYDSLFTAVNLLQAKTALCGPFSAELLLDQTGSMVETDPLNLRLTAADAYLDAATLIGSGDEVQLSTFRTYNGLRWQSYGPFTNDYKSLEPIVASLAGQQNGNTPLYDAMYAFTDTLINQAQYANRVLIVLTDGQDNDSHNTTLQGAIDHARQNNVKVFAIALKTGINTPLIAAAMSTGGSVMHASDAAQMVPYFKTLDKQAHGGASYYKTQWHVKLTNAYTLSGQTVSGNLKIAMPGKAAVLAPFAVTFP